MRPRLLLRMNRARPRWGLWSCRPQRLGRLRELCVLSPWGMRACSQTGWPPRAHLVRVAGRSLREPGLGLGV